MGIRVTARGSRGRLGALLASSSVTALLIGGGAPAASAACADSPATNQIAVGNSGSINCINISGITVTGNVTNTSSGTITTTGSSAPTATGISIINSSIGGTVSNAGAISAGVNGIRVSSVAVFGSSSAGESIVNSGTISARHTGIWVDHVSIFLGGINSSGTISAGWTGVYVGVSTFAGGISNSGTISAGYFGIELYNVSTFTGGISNGGTISSNGADGTYVTGVSTFAGRISNSGTMSAVRSGISINSASTFAGAVANSGVIRGDIGIHVSNVGMFGSSATGGIANSGTISGGNTGIGVSSVSTFTGGISNSGTISSGRYGVIIGVDLGTSGPVSTSIFSGGITNSGSITAGVTGIYINNVSTFLGGITNSGTISSAGFGIAASSVNTFGSTSAGGGITNSGTIVAAAGPGMYVALVGTFAGGVSNAGTVTAPNGIYVVAVSAFNGGIGNAGTISAGTHGILIGVVSTFSGGITNSGTISANCSGATCAGIYINNVSTFSGNISNSGTITGANAVSIDSGVTFAAGGAVVNSGTITGATAAIDTSAATSPVTIDQAGGAINGAIKLSSNADALNVSGGAINGNVVGTGSRDTINFNLGSGAFTYSSAYGFSGINQVNINSGTVVLNGTNSAGAIDVNGGTLAGTGTLSSVTVNNGGTLAPGTPGVAGTTLAINGNLAFQSAAIYLVTLNGSAASRVNVSGAVTLNGALDVDVLRGSYNVKTTYDVLDPTSISGRFTSVSLLGAPGLSANITYTPTAVLLNLTADIGTGGSLNLNQRNVANGINNSFNNAVTLPAGFSALVTSTGSKLGNALSQASGEDATGAQRSSFQLMNAFLGLMLDPTAGGAGGADGGGAPAFAPEQDISLPPEIAHAYADVLQDNITTTTPPSFEQRWSAWGASFGGTGRINGNAATGSNNVTASDFGFAAGMDYHATPNITYGFGLAGGGTNWSLAQGLGSGRSDALLAAVYAKTHWGPLYVSGAMAFANHWFTTNRTALGDQLRGSFTGQDYAARLESGYRQAVPISGAIVGVTPYAALQVQDLHTPTYSEADLSGGGLGLSYAAVSATDTRGELGARFDNLQIVNAMPLILRGRLAWAHDWVSSPSLGAVFQTLPGSNFIVYGAAPPKNAALATAAAELHVTPSWTAIAKLDGELAPGAQAYAGTGTLRYSW